MSLPAFQQALGALVADRAFCRDVREDAAMALAGRDLSPREIRRLAAMAGTPGMKASGKLYRFNRLTPLYRCLPRTLATLGPTLPGLIDAFWRAYPETRLQFEEEVAWFTAFIEAQMAAGAVLPPLAVDTLAFEAAACQLLFRSGDETTLPRSSDGAARLHPLVAVVRFRMEPAMVFAGSAGAPGEHYVVLDARGSELQVTTVPAAMGRVLALVQAGTDVADDAACQPARAAGWLLAQA